MICPQCQTENPNTAKFCSNCGSILILRCTNCQAELIPGARFCMQCGQAVRKQTPDDEALHTRLAASAPAPLAEKIRTALNKPFELAQQSLQISCSIGMTLYPEHAKNETEMMNYADIAMYQAKQKGRDKVQVFELK